MLKLKKIIFVFVAASFIGAFWANTAQAVVDIEPVEPVVVTFPDSNLETVVRDYLNIQTGDITDTDMASLMGSFVADDRSISNIHGMEYATNLTNLDLDSNEISNISPLSGLTNLTRLDLYCNRISDISSLSGLTNLTELYLDSNQISDTSPLSGLTNLTKLTLSNNLYIEMLDLHGSNFSSLYYFDIGDNPVTEVCLANATLSQPTFNALMDDGELYHDGIADSRGIVKLDLSGVDFGNISDFSKMYTMDDLETLLLTDATNLDGNEVVAWTGELDSLNWLDVVGLWDSFDTNAQNSLLAWDAIDGNTLVYSAVPEPATLTMLLTLAALAMFYRKRRTA